MAAGPSSHNSGSAPQAPLPEHEELLAERSQFLARSYSFARWGTIGVAILIALLLLNWGFL